MNVTQAVVLLGAGLAAGTVNAVAGGGSLVTFPTLLAVGLPPISATVTNSVAVFPGYVASVYRSRVRGGLRWLLQRGARRHARRGARAGDRRSPGSGERAEERDLGGGRRRRGARLRDLRPGRLGRRRGAHPGDPARRVRRCSPRPAPAVHRAAPGHRGVRSGRRRRAADPRTDLRRPARQRRCDVSFTVRTATAPSAYMSTMDRPPGSRYRRCSSASLAASASRRISLIGVTWLTSTTPRPGYSDGRRATTPETREATSEKGSPPGGATSAPASHASSSAGHRRRTSAKVSPSQAPKSHSIRSGSTRTGPSAAAATTA